MEDEEYAGYQNLVDEQQQTLIDFVQGVDVMIADSQYTLAEYPTKKGWGHGTFEGNIELARLANIKQFYFTHHDPTRSDKALDEIFAGLMEQDNLPDTEFHLAKEGTIIEL